MNKGDGFDKYTSNKLRQCSLACVTVNPIIILFLC